MYCRYVLYLLTFCGCLCSLAVLWQVLLTYHSIGTYNQEIVINILLVGTQTYPKEEKKTTLFSVLTSPFYLMRYQSIHRDVNVLIQIEEYLHFFSLCIAELRYHDTSLWQVVTLLSRKLSLKTMVEQTSIYGYQNKLLDSLQVNLSPQAIKISQFLHHKITKIPRYLFIV